MKTLRVLVTNARRRKAVPIVRALGKAGMYVVCTDSIWSATAFYSRYCNEKLVHPEVQSEQFLDFMISWLSRNNCDAIFPLDDDVLDILSKNRNLLPNPDVLMLPDHSTVSKVNDKSWLIPYAAKAGIMVPNTVIIESNEDLEQLSNIELPAIVKPSHGSGGRGIVWANRTEELERICKAAISQGERILVQEQVPPEGEGLGYFALYNRNKQLVAEFMHRRLREYPILGGPSTLRKGIWDDDLAQQSRFLLESLDWIGLAMVEYKQDPRDGLPKLMEINPRFWGSIALPIFSGVNFPVLLGKLTVGEAVPTVAKYPLGKKARWLWPGDILHFISSLRQGRWPKDFFTFWDSDMCYDILSLTDPLPAIALLLSTFMTLVSPGGWSHVVKRSG